MRDTILSIFKKYEIDSNDIRPILLSVATADFIRGTNPLFVDADKACMDELLSELFDLPPVNTGIKTELPMVQQARLVCDSIILYLAERGKYESWMHLTGVASSMLASIMGVKVKGTDDYADADECDRLLSRLAEEEVEEVDLLSDCFTYISETLGKMSSINKVVGKKIFSEDMSNVYLAEGYDSHGFVTSTVVTNRLKPAQKFDDFDYYVELAFNREVVNSIVKLVVDGDDSQLGVAGLIYKLERIRSGAKSSIPVSINCFTSEVKSISLHKYSNPVAIRYIEDVFSTRADSSLSRNSVYQVFQIIKALYPKKNFGGDIIG